jgi:glycosyltransferase involved in cell wall biosynthesis
VALTLAATLIVGGGKRAKELRVCLESLVTQVPLDQLIIVHTGSRDHADRVVEEFRDRGPEVTLIQQQWDDDFARARNAALERVKTDWWFWIDSDDVLEGGENLRPMLEALDEDYDGVWLPYFYSFDEHGNCTVLHDRERVFRSSVGWKWRDALHESCGPSRPARWHWSTDVKFIHMRPPTSQGDRNLRILYKMLEENPDNIRTWMYLGNQFYSQGEWQTAAEWYLKFYQSKKPSGMLHDRWSSMVYCARALRRAERVQEAIKSDNSAMFQVPKWADSYLGMGENMMLLEHYEEAVHWFNLALQMEPPDRITFINQLDYTYRPYYLLSYCYMVLEDYEKAIPAIDQALSVRPDQDLQDRRQDAEYLLNLQKRAASLEQVVPEMPLDAVLELGQNGFKEEMRFKNVRDVVAPRLLQKVERGTQPKAVIFCGPTLEDWGPESPSTTGIGGSETAVIEIARRLQSEGYQAVVYSQCGEQEGLHDGVLYTSYERFRPEAISAELLISWRGPQVALDRTPKIQEKWYWIHDMNMGDRFTEKHARGFDKIFGVSQFHQDYLKLVYPFLREMDVGYLYNGIDLGRFAGASDTKKKRFRSVYSSSPDRGLLTLLRLWKHVLAMESKAELHIFYGWQSFDKAILSGAVHLLALKDEVERLLNQPGIFWRGRLPQDELAKEFAASEIWAFPSDFLETGCITAMEAMASGLIPVTSYAGAIPEVVGHAGMLTTGDATSPVYQRVWLEAMEVALHDNDSRISLRERAFNRANRWTWDKAYAECWLPLLKQTVTT